MRETKTITLCTIDRSVLYLKRELRTGVHRLIPTLGLYESPRFDNVSGRKWCWVPETGLGAAATWLLDARAGTTVTALRSLIILSVLDV
jgi:hypothetical protein